MRGSQENFFKYGREHFNLDRLIDYQLEPVDETTRIVNPTWRRLDGQVRRSAALQHRGKARLHDLELQGALDAKTEHYLSRAEPLRSEIEAAATTLKTLTGQRKTAGKHTTVSELPEEEKFLKLATGAG